MHSTALRYFLQVAECASIRQAAERLHVSSSAVSRQIAKLERDIDAPLLERNARGVALTEAGRLLAAFGGRSSRDMEQIRSQINDLNGLRKGHVTIATVEAMVAEFLPRCLAAFQARHPGIIATVNVIGTHAIAEAVLDHEADIGIAYGTPKRQDLTIQAALPQPLHAILSSKHPFASRKSVFLSEFRNAAVALPNRSFGIRQMVDRASVRAGFTFSKILETNSLEMAKGLVRHSMAVTFMPLLTVFRDIELGALIARPLRDSTFASSSIEVLTATDRSLPRAPRALLVEIQQALAHLKTTAVPQRAKSKTES